MLLYAKGGFMLEKEKTLYEFAMEMFMGLPALLISEDPKIPFSFDFGDSSIIKWISPAGSGCVFCFNQETNNSQIILLNKQRNMPSAEEIIFDFWFGSISQICVSKIQIKTFTDLPSKEVEEINQTYQEIKKAVQERAALFFILTWST